MSSSQVTSIYIPCISHHILVNSTLILEISSRWELLLDCPGNVLQIGSISLLIWPLRSVWGEDFWDSGHHPEAKYSGMRKIDTFYLWSQFQKCVNLWHVNLSHATVYRVKNPERRRWPNGRTVEFPRSLSDAANNSRNVICNIRDFLEYLEEPRSIWPNDYLSFKRSWGCL